MSRLAGKSAVITGAAKGIGRATADLFATEGARLVATDIDAVGLDRLRADLDSRGTECATVVGDVSNADDAQRMIAAAVEHYGRLDILVANAGVIPLGAITESSADDWDSVMAVDGRGMFLTCKYAIEAMLESGGGSIVCLSSISGMAGQSRQSTYWAGKVRRLGAHHAPGGRVGRQGHPGQRGRAGHDPNGGRPPLPSNPAARSTSRRSGSSTRWVGSASPRRSPARSPSSRPTQASFITGAILPVDGGYLAR